MHPSALHKLVPVMAAGLVLSLASRDETSQPSQRFVLTLGDQQIEIAEGAPFEFNSGTEVLRGLLRGLPFRTLAIEELQFDYPSELSFEYEALQGTETWTLRGHEVTLMLYRFEVGGPTPELLALFTESVAQGFTDTEVLHAPASLTLDGRTHQGVRLAWQFGGFDHVQEVYALDPKGPARRALVLQDTRELGSGPSREWLKLYPTLKDTYDWQAR